MVGFTEPRVNGLQHKTVATVKGQLVPVGYAQLSVTAAQGLTGAPTTARLLMLTIEGNAIRWRDDGTAPTAAIGMPLAVGSTLSYDGPPSALQIISQTGTATVNVAYYS